MTARAGAGMHCAAGMTTLERFAQLARDNPVPGGRNAFALAAGLKAAEGAANPFHPDREPVLHAEFAAGVAIRAKERAREAKADAARIAATLWPAARERGTGNR